MEQNEQYLRDSVLLRKLVFLFRVVVLLDISATNSMYIIHIQHSLRLLLEEQLSNKDSFNVIAYAARFSVRGGGGEGEGPPPLGAGAAGRALDTDVTGTQHPWGGHRFI